MDLGSLLAGTGQAQPMAPPQAPPPGPGAGGYSNWMLAQSQLPPPPQRSFSVPLSFRPNMTKPNALTAHGQVPTSPTAAPAPGKVATSPGAPTSSPMPQPVKPMSTPFSNYQGKSIGNPAGMMSNKPGFSS